MLFCIQSLVSKGLKANEWVNQISELIKGKGGGKDLSAQAIGTNTSALNEAVSITTSYVQEKLGLKPSVAETSRGETTCSGKVSAEKGILC